MIKQKWILSLGLLIIYSIIVVHIFDFVFGKKVISRASGYVHFNNGWYELKPNFSGKDGFDMASWNLFTDDSGFRVPTPNFSPKTKFSTIFLGDSFTYGATEYEDTFVGQYEKKSGDKAINAGVGGYSPTTYLYNYLKALNSKKLLDGHKLIVSIDISDVQNEANVWTWDQKISTYPSKISESDSKVVSKKMPSTLVRIKNFYTSHFPLTTYFYNLTFFKTKNSKIENKGMQNTEIFNYKLSAFTWENWETLDAGGKTDSAYYPFGVSGGLEKLALSMSKITDLAKSRNATVYFLIYPWPAQLHHKNIFDWPSWIQNLCNELNCSGVIDVFPQFMKKSETNPLWLEYYFIKNDVHYNVKGNEIVADTIYNYFEVHK